MPSTYSVAQYIADLRAIRDTGSATAETSFYPPLDRLFNAAGETLKPKVLFSTQLRSQGAGMPDGGFFPQPSRRARATEPPLLQNPERGAVEIKPADYNLNTLATEPQTLGYLQQYGLVLITNLREFRLLEVNPAGPPHLRESYVLANTPNDLWHGPIDSKHNDLLPDFLRRVMLYRAPLSQPKDVAWLLASYAREARARAEDHPLPSFEAVKTALQESLGIQFEGEKGEHFFRSTLVQTLFYGIFSAWILWRRSPEARLPNARFDWRVSAHYLRVPVLRQLFNAIADPGPLNAVQLTEVLNLAGEALNRVQPAFFETFNTEDAVAYFYEPFLEAFDPQLRKDLGVWYTPKEIVHYMVERVDQLLRTELAQPLGLASTNVRILDPCCGTGAYLTAVLQRIHRTLLEQAGEDNWRVPDRLRTAALTRVFGFEIMPAPFVIAHMEIASLLESCGAPLTGEQADGTPAQRAGVYLTNALTGWVPVEHPQIVMYPEMEQEREASDNIKQHGTILVILGNPPYNGYAGIANIDEERDLTTAYRAPVAGLPAPQGQGLNDLYIRFFRIAERRIASNPDGQGIVSFISNNAWLDGLSHTTMRHHYLQTFPQIFIDNLNGDKYRTGKTTPDGKPDPSAFSTSQNREGIQVGTAIATLVRNNNPSPTNPQLSSFREAGGPASLSTATNPGIHLRDLWGTEKLAQLEHESRREAEPAYTPLTPVPALGNPFAYRIHSTAYTSWPRLPELFPVSFPGIKTSRDPLVVDIDRDRLEIRMKKYFDSSVSHDEMARYLPEAMEDGYMYQARAIRSMLQPRGFRQWEILRYSYRPFDLRWIYWEPETSLLRRKVEEFAYQLIGETKWLEARQRESGDTFARGTVVSGLADNFGNGLSSFFPVVVIESAGTLLSDIELRPNLSDAAQTYLASLDQPGDATAPSAIGAHHTSLGRSPRYSPADNPRAESPAHNAATESMGNVTDNQTGAQTNLFFHALAIMHTPQYRIENAGALLGDWPRIPLPATAELLTRSATLGRQLAELLDPESEIKLLYPECDTGFPIVWSFFAALKLPRPADLAENLKVTAGWGRRGQSSTVMPGPGQSTTRPWTEAERTHLQWIGEYFHLTLDQVLNLLGETCLDIHLNGNSFWTAVPANVWEYTLGGYQVLKKWLSYRELTLLERPLHPEEAEYFSQVVRRIAAILLLGPALDASYQAILPTATGLPT